MPTSGISERNRLGLLLTPRQPSGFFTNVTTESTAPSTCHASGCSSTGLDVSFLETRLKHVAAVKKHMQTLRHPLHRFCTHKLPVVVDADFLPLYRQRHLARPADEQPQLDTTIRAFSNLRYRAPNAPVDGRDRISCSRGSNGWLPWRHTPRVIPPDGLRLWDDVCCVLMQLFVNGSLFWVPALLVWVWRRHCTTRRRKVFFVIIVLSLILFPVRPRPGIRKWRGWRNIHRYHRTSAIVEGAETFPPREPTIYAVFPHGIVPVAPVAMATGDFINVLGHFRLTAASIVRWCLIYGQLIFLSDAIPADRKSMKDNLEQGANLLVSPGGIAEIYETSPSQERLHLQDRLGVVRLAMETGAKLVPVYCFGNSQAYRLPWGVRFLQPFARLLRMALVTFYGRFGLPVAFRVPLLYAIGRPLQLPQTDNPSKVEIASAHQLLMGEVQRIFDKYKGLYGWTNKQLEIV